jgi:hypothetical protein
VSFLSGTRTDLTKVTVSGKVIVIRTLETFLADTSVVPDIFSSVSNKPNLFSFLFLTTVSELTTLFPFYLY